MLSLSVVIWAEQGSEQDKIYKNTIRSCFINVVVNLLYVFQIMPVSCAYTALYKTLICNVLERYVGAKTTN